MILHKLARRAQTRKYQKPEYSSQGHPISTSLSRSIQRSNLTMADSVYKVIELVGTSKESWEKAALAAVNKAGKTLRDLRVAEVGRLDLQLKDGKVEAFRARVTVSFKYEGGT